MKDYVRDAILDISKKNAKNYKIFDIDDDTNYNFIYLSKIDYDNSSSILKNRKNQEDYPRKNKMIKYYNEKIFPNLNIKDNIHLKVSLHDKCDIDGVLTFGSHIDNKVVLIPDMYQMNNYGKDLFLSDKDDTKFTDKINKVVFYGTSTGSLNPSLNTRLNTCIWSVKDEWAKKMTDIKITKLAQISLQDINIYGKQQKIDIKNIFANHVSIEEQFKNKYILSIDGITWAWNRPIWIMNSNSLLFKYESEKIGWYYPLLKENKHYVSVSVNTIQTKHNFFENNTNQALHIIEKSKTFVKDYCSEEACIFYLRSLLEEISSKF